MAKKEYYEVDGIKLPKVVYYKAHNDNYVKKEKGSYYVVREGKLVFNQYWGQIQFGELDAVEITEEEFNEALEKSKNGVEGYK